MRRQILATTFAVLVAISPAMAESFDVSVVAVGVSDDEFHGLIDGSMVIDTRTLYEPYDAPGSPLSGMTSLCFGNVVVLDGMPGGGGNCILTGAGGDTILQQFAVTDIALGTAAGTWVLLRGTGAYEGVAGEGTWSSETVARTGATTNLIEGRVSLP